ncbi:MAG: M20 family metallopeptidase [Chloroflexota bacterium]
MNKAALKERIREAIDQRRQELIDISLELHRNPELSFQETKASALLSGFLEKNGFTVERGICGLPTAFRGTYGSGKPSIAILAEYDALPQVGHACGHNVIAAAAVGAGIAGRLAVDKYGGSVVVMGTPGEEGGGGKIIMVEQGAFKDLDCAMMVHPSRRDSAMTEALAAIGIKVEFFGKAAHAASDPEAGINALEALILSFNNINSLRQHIGEKARIHGIIKDGGAAPNIVPDYSCGVFLVRAPNMNYLENLKTRVLDCFTGAALATGARLEYSWNERLYASMKNSLTLAHLFSANMEAIGRKIDPSLPRLGMGSTDMGNVSQVVPSIHGWVAIAPSHVSEHTPEFAKAAASEAGHKGLIDGAKAMAMTVADLFAEPELFTKLRWEHANRSD